jgi:hypothetical protein
MGILRFVGKASHVCKPVYFALYIDYGSNYFIGVVDSKPHDDSQIYTLKMKD